MVTTGVIVTHSTTNTLLVIHSITNNTYIVTTTNNNTTYNTQRNWLLVWLLAALEITGTVTYNHICV